VRRLLLLLLLLLRCFCCIEVRGCCACCCCWLAHLCWLLRMLLRLTSLFAVGPAQTVGFAAASLEGSCSKQARPTCNGTASTLEEALANAALCHFAYHKHIDDPSFPAVTFACHICSGTASSVEEALAIAAEIGRYPLIIIADVAEYPLLMFLLPLQRHCQLC
jgi:hypothetical protein